MSVAGCFLTLRQEFGNYLSTRLSVRRPNIILRAFLKSFLFQHPFMILCFDYFMFSLCCEALMNFSIVFRPLWKQGHLDSADLRQGGSWWLPKFNGDFLLKRHISGKMFYEDLISFSKDMSQSLQKNPSCSVEKCFKNSWIRI